jgi:zinc protease
MRRIPLLTALAASLALALSLRAALPFPQAESDLKADSAAHFGTLPNGLRYVVMPNHEPKARASLRLLVLAGSFDETEAQRGLAHYLEHMAFNGSTHYAPGTLVEKLQRLGMGFGADTNASTSFDHTLYQLELPDTAPATLAEGLQILSDYCGGLLLDQKMVDKERGIILSEKRSRDSVGYRTFVAQLDFMLQGTRVPERLPIGLEDVITKSNRDPFVEFYNTWYRPEKMVVIVVGDIDAPSIEKQIVDGFSGISARSPEPPEVDLGKVPVFKGLKALYHGEPEAPNTNVVIATAVPYVEEPDTAAVRLKYLPRMLAFDILNLRLEILSKQENAPFIRAGASVEDSFHLYRQTEINVACKAEQWADALGVADKEMRRAYEYGFNDDELKQVVSNFRNALEQADKTASTRRSDELAGDLAQSLVDREVFTSPADDLALYGPALSKVTLADCLAAYRQAWSSQGRFVIVSGNAKIVGVANAANAIVAAAYNRARAVPIKAPDARASITWGYSDFGPPGKVASRTHIDDLDFTEVVFENGVRLNIKKTDFEANTIHVGARLGTGMLTEPASTEPGLSRFSALTFSAGGLGKHGEDDLQQVLAGKTVGVLFSSTTDAFLFEGGTNKDDLALEFQLLTASITDPGYRQEALRQARKRIEAAYISFAHTERGPMNLKVPRLLASGDPRFGLPSRDEMMARNLDEVKAWLAPQLASGALEVSVIGDLDVDTVIECASRTIGTLPKRDPKPALDDLKKVSYPSKPFTWDYSIESEIPKGLVAVYWPTSDGADVHRARRLNILGDILGDRLRVKIREQLGSTYSPNVGSFASDIFPGYGYLEAAVIVDPAKTKQIQDVVVAVAGDMSANGITQDELDRAKNPKLTALRESERTNTYWMTVLLRAQERPEVLDWARSRKADFESISKADVDALAKAFLSPDKASRVIVRPYTTPVGSGPLKVAPATPPPDGS